MTDRDSKEQDLRIELMQTQIDRFRQEMRWQPWLAIATFLTAAAAFAGVILAVAHFIR